MTYRLSLELPVSQAWLETHYDGHDYMDEKRQALESLFRLLDAPEASNVVQFKAG